VVVQAQVEVVVQVDQVDQAEPVAVQAHLDQVEQV
jgi:hypothetical protein